MTRDLVYLRSHYPHWARRSGYKVLVDAMRREGHFAVSEMVTEGEAGEAGAEPPGAGHDAILPWYSPASQLSEVRVARQIEGGAGGIFHFLDGEHGYYYSMRFGGRPDVRLVATFHQPVSVLESHGLLGDKRQIFALDAAVVLTEEQGELFRRYLPADRVFVIPHGIDTRAFCPGRAQREREDELRLVCVGFWLRDLALLGRCAEMLAGEGIARFHLVGLRAGVERGAVERRDYERLCALPNVAMHDGISDGALLALYRGADALALPLLDCTANNALLEGAACGLPVVTTDLPGTRVYLSEECALFSDKGDAEAFGESIRVLAQAAEWRESAARAVRRRMVERFDWARIGAIYSEMYREIAEKPQQARPPRKPARPERRAMCTVITSDYLVQALALAKSVHQQGATELYVLVSDSNYSKSAFERIRRELAATLTLLSLDDLGEALPAYESEDSVRWALKPPLMLHLLERLGYEKVIFVDSDVCFFDDYEFLFRDLDRFSVLLTPHRRSIDPSVDENQFRCNFLHGVYNAGFVGASKRGIPAISWWRDACYYRCDKGMKEGFYVDQRYLDVIPAYFEDVGIVRHCGCNVAEWNRERLLRVADEKGGYAENWPIVFIHFSDLTIEQLGQGLDPCLEAYMAEYQRLMAAAEEEVTRNAWELRRNAWEFSRSQAAAEPRRPLGAREGSLELCTVVDGRSIDQLRILVSTVRRCFDPAPQLSICCADYESLDRLRKSGLDPWCRLFHWDAMAAYPLQKEHGLYAGDQRRFSRICRPFAVAHLTERTEGRVCFLAPGAAFLRPPQRVLEECSSAGSAVLLPRLGEALPASRFNRCDYWLVAAGRGDREFLDFWRLQALKRREWDKIAVPEFGARARLSFLSEGCALIVNGSRGSGERGPGSHELLCVEDRYDARTGSAGESKGMPAWLEELLHGLREETRLETHDGEDLAEVLARIPQADLLRVAYGQGRDLEDFGRQWGFRRDADLEAVLKAYLIYLVAAMYRRQGSLQRANELFRSLAETELLLPDLYRSKTLVHLGDLAVEDGELLRAVAHYREAMVRAPNDPAIASKLSGLEEGQQQATALGSGAVLPGGASPGSFTRPSALSPRASGGVPDG